ncbi:MAG TPA: hypothetical protein VKQ09_11020 [Sphingomonas sp.]|nr:hypothetical protein [Sphingomonas sp.]
MDHAAFTAEIRSIRLRRPIPFVCGAIFFTFMIGLYCAGEHVIYERIIRAWGVLPFTFPFVDTDTVLSAVRCMQRGVDVYAANPCDVLRRVYDYSPLWLVLARVPGAGTWLRPIGLSVDIAFLSSLLLLPVGRGWRDTMLIVLGAVSTAAVFAVERANNDLVIFVLVATAATLIQRSAGWRLLGYTATLLAGLLKYYPMPLMIVATRERPGHFFTVAAGSLTIVGLFLVVDGHDLARALRLIPTGPYIDDMFGSIQLPGGLSDLFGWPAGVRTVLHLAMMAAAIGGGIIWGRSQLLREDIERLSRQEQAFLLVGALLLPSLFFTAQNIGYRAIHLLLVLPPLLALRHAGHYRRAHSYTGGAALALLWAEGWRHLIAVAATYVDTDLAAFLYAIAWLTRETMWWWTITALVALATNMQLHSEMGRIGLSGLRQAISTRTAARAVAQDDPASPYKINAVLRHFDQ